MKVLFFGQVRESVLVDQVIVATSLKNVRALKDHLSERGDNWLEALNHKDVLVAVNQTLCDDDTCLSCADEVAFFPPVTGG